MCTFHCLYMNTVVRGDLFVNQCLELLVLYKHLRHARGAYYVGKNLALLQFEIMSCTSERKCVHSDWQELQSKRKLTTDTHAQTRVRLYVGHSSQCFMYTLDAPTLHSHDHLGTHIVLHIVKWKKKKNTETNDHCMTVHLIEYLAHRPNFTIYCVWLNVFWHRVEKKKGKSLAVASQWRTAKVPSNLVSFCEKILLKFCLVKQRTIDGWVREHGRRHNMAMRN